ncbi:signal peptidase II [Psychrobacter sp. I-STPA6b]|uniref:signal peptidase II n=1 Tax=Psychrobacter sp. I-STPA6b TaxID=2585718 RepID=UPI001D0C1269|nr:signal peptidase II [Psychrobacter sp. I-STPA6b]
MPNNNTSPTHKDISKPPHSTAGNHLEVQHDTQPKYVSAQDISANTALIRAPKANGSQALIWYGLSVFVIILDQWTKWLAEHTLSFHQPVPVIEPVLSWTLAYNYGAAFSWLANQSGWQKWFFAGLALVMSIFLMVYLVRAPRTAKLLNLGLALILGGAVGNLIDRVRLGHVVDFIHVHYADVWHYPIFNIADIAICVGVFFVIIDMLFLENKRSI